MRFVRICLEWSVHEKVAMFFTIISHHTKNRSVKYHFKRSGQTISKHFHSVLHAVLMLHSLFFVQPVAVPDDSTDPQWGSFKDCLGALDGMYIDVQVPAMDKGRYRNRKGHVSVNVVGVCDMNMKFIYVLTGWEGSAADSRVLRDAVNRTHGLRVPRGTHTHYCSMNIEDLRSSPNAVGDEDLLHELKGILLPCFSCLLIELIRLGFVGKQED
ncbi:hypothetical protein ACS0TY_008199 [Phlomoides rotata]